MIVPTVFPTAVLAPTEESITALVMSGTVVSRVNVPAIVPIAVAFAASPSEIVTRTFALDVNAIPAVGVHVTAVVVVALFPVSVIPE